MKSVSALDIRRSFGKILDEAAAGERIVIERAGQPVAALVPLSDLPELDRDARIQRRREAIADIARLARQRPVERSADAATLIRAQRLQRTRQIVGTARTDEADAR
jgi:prevent-host-death family protein